VLAVIAPNVDSAQRRAEVSSSLRPSASIVAPAPGSRLDAFADRPSAGMRSSRSLDRRGTGSRPALLVVKRAVRQVAKKLVAREPMRIAAMRPGAGSRRPAAIVLRHSFSRPFHRRWAGRTRSASRPTRMIGVLPSMAGVIAYARSQIGKVYVIGGDGPFGFDCSGLTQSAYARAGLRLPHSSGGQAARAHSISRSAARAGDLVVGRGHVGVYMGGGMMIDAGNRRTGVSYRRVYAGLSIERF
jgi:cell wall-associated NlpC family hydrolase